MSQNIQPLEARKKYRDYLLWLFAKINTFPQKQKFILGERIGTTALDIAQKIIEIQYAPKEAKFLLLGKFNLELETLRELMRLAQGMNFISRKAFLWQELKIDEVGRMTWGLVCGKKDKK